MALALASPPRISLPLFTRILVAAGSPAAPEAAACYAAIQAHGIDPAVGLAFFQHESGYGLRGVAVKTYGWGNVTVGALGVLKRGTSKRIATLGGRFAAYATWADGVHDWCLYMRARYLDRGLTTVEAIIPIYAPSSDNNKPAAYIAAVRGLVARWEAAGGQDRGEDRRYVVIEPRGANVRSGKGREHSIVRKLAHGQVVSVAQFVEGERVAGSARWAELTTDEYVWAGLLRPHGED